MNGRKLIPVIIASTFILALGGTLLVGYSSIFNDPFSAGSEDENIPPGNKEIDPDPSYPVEDEEESIPDWALPVAGACAIFAMVFFLASGNLYLRSKRGENLVRTDLLDLITINPGINLSSIRKELELSQGAVSYHIMKLEKTGQIISEKGSKERRYYPSSMGYQAAMRQAHLDEMESILSNDTSRGIVELLKIGPCSQNDLVNQLDISPSTVHWHMERMKKVGMISKENRGRSVFYELMEIPPANT